MSLVARSALLVLVLGGCSTEATVAPGAPDLADTPEPGTAPDLATAPDLYDPTACLRGPVLAIDIAPVRLAGRLTVAGAGSPARAGLVLRGGGGDGVRLGSLADGRYQASVLPGAYEVYYDNPTPDASGAPLNSAGRLRAVEIRADGSLDIDVPVVKLRGTVQSGQRPLAGARLRLISSDGQGAVPILTDADGRYEVAALPGTYDVYSDASVPLRRAVDLSADATVDLSITMSRVRGRFTVAGAAPSGGGTLWLRLRQSGYMVALGALSAGQYQREVPAGRYDVVYRGPGADLASRDDPAPRGGGVVVSEVDLSADAVLDVDVPTVAVGGAITVGGAPLPGRAGFADGTVWIDDGQGGRSLLATTGEGRYLRAVVPGRYNLGYAAPTAAALPELPRNRQASLRSVTIAAGALDVDVPVVRAAGLLTLGGAVAAADQGEVYLVDAGGDRLSLGTLSLGSYEALLLPGLYRALYGARSLVMPPAGLPANAAVPLRALTLVANTTADLDVPRAAPLRGALTVAGAPPPRSDAAQLFLLGRAGDGDSVSLGTLDPGGFTRNVLPGQYDLYYLATGAPPSPLPGNYYRRLACVDVP